MNSVISKLARLTALIGGVALVALILMTSLSIVGRALARFGLGPVPGDFEIVEAGIAFCVFAFLPLAQLHGGHATVDLFTAGLPTQFNRILLALWETLMAAIVALIAWRLFAGAENKFSNGETSLLLQFPIWWAYAACLAPAAVAVVVALWSAYDRVRSALTGRDSRPIAGESLH